MSVQGKPTLYSADRAAQKIWAALHEDFSASEGEDFCRKAADRFRDDISEFRKDDSFPELGILPVGRFKRYEQLKNLLKKYRFEKDVYLDAKLDEITIDSYFSNQVRLSQYAPLKPIGLMVCQEARKIARRILGEFPADRLHEFSKFGRKSSIGCPFRLAYIDHKLTDVRAFTGSSECAKWFFNEVLPKDQLLSQMVDNILKQGKADLQHESLTLINVPKSWKTHRTITPLTLIGLYYSYGIGGLVTEKLAENARLDIRRLQNRHRYLVERFSRDLSHATADLSSASDSITTSLLNRILPRDWFQALKKCLTHQVDIGDSRFYTESVLPMGNGATFPVETLIFYCIIKALGNLSGVKGIYSVYGDDLIYPSRLHKYVATVFPMLQLVLNKDKTYVSYPFRESCGADYYRGCDVRSFYLQTEKSHLTRTQYQAFLYKAYNGLTRRWDELEVSRALRFILIELTRVSDSILRVPPSYPDDAGIKTTSPGIVPLGCWYAHFAPVEVLFHQGSRWIRFQYLCRTARHRWICEQKPYYWLSLQGKKDDPSEGNFWETDYSYLHKPAKPPISWVKLKHKRRYVLRNGKQKCAVKVTYKPAVPSRDETVTKSETGSISDWI